MTTQKLLWVQSLIYFYYLFVIIQYIAYINTDECNTYIKDIGLVVEIVITSLIMSFLPRLRITLKPLWGPISYFNININDTISALG